MKSSTGKFEIDIPCEEEQDCCMLTDLSVTHNGTYMPDDSHDGFYQVDVNVDGYPEPTGTVNITQNGTSNVKDYASADVNVPNSYSASDEGKVVSNGALVAQGSQTITQNGTYDTTLISELIANISGGGAPLLPEGYKRTLYTQGDGAAYVNVGYNPSSQTTVKGVFHVTDTQNTFLFGSRVARQSDAFDFLYQATTSASTRYRIDYGSTETSQAEVSDNTLLDIVFGHDGFSINNVSISVSGSFSGNALPLYLLSGNNNGQPSSNSVSKCFLFQIKEDDSVVRNLVPCIRESDNKAGFYDIVGNIFYGNNEVSGSLIAGPEIPN